MISGPWVTELVRPLTMDTGGIILMDVLWSDPTENDSVAGAFTRSLSAQLERTLWDRGCMDGLFRGCLRGVEVCFCVRNGSS
jgi:hypothetical protein